MSDTMVRFRYEGETVEGEEVKGEIKAASSLAARNELALNGTRVSKLTERKGLNVEITKKGVPLIDIMHFCRQMASFMRAGVPVTDAMGSLRDDCDNKELVVVLDDMIQLIGTGSTVGDAAARHADVFPPYFVAIIRSADLTGRMDRADELHRYIKRDARASGVRKALIYPMIPGLACRRRHHRGVRHSEVCRVLRGVWSGFRSYPHSHGHCRLRSVDKGADHLWGDRG
ncbi:MAG: type II secretion system F family protein [Microthrixaceae bacterium]